MNQKIKKINLKQSFKSEKWAILYGAGISFDAPANVPLGYDLIEVILKEVLINDYVGTIGNFLNIKDTDLRAGKFLRFEQLCEIIEKQLNTLDFLDFFNHYQKPNKNHVNLANLAKNGHILLTTNFDELVEIAANNINFKLDKVVFPNDKQDIMVKKATLYKLHGSIKNQNILTTRESISNPQTNSLMLQFIDKILQEYNILVIGYSGFDDFDISPILQLTKSKKMFVWINHLNSGDYQAKSFEELNTIQDIKFKILLENIYANGNRDINNLFIIEGNTSKILSSLVKNHRKEKSAHIKSNLYIDYKKFIQTFFSKNITLEDKLHITCMILYELHKYTEIQNVLDNYYILPNWYKNYTKKKEYSITILLRSFAQTKKEICMEDIKIYIKFQEKFNNIENKISLINSIGIFYYKMGFLKEAKEYFSKTIILAKEYHLINWELIGNINYPLILNSLTEHEKYLKDTVVPLAHKVNNINYLAAVYNNLAHCANNDGYRRKAIKYSIITGNFQILVENILILGIDNFPIQFELIKQMYYFDKSYFDNILSLDYQILFYSLISKYVYTKKEIEQISKKNNELLDTLLTSNSYTDEKFIAFFIELVSFDYSYDRFDNVKKIYYKYGLFFEEKSILHNKLTIYTMMAVTCYKTSDSNVKYYLNRIKNLIKENDKSLIFFLFYYYYEITDYDNAIKIGESYLNIATNSNLLENFVETLGNLYFNKKEYFIAKEYYLRSFEYIKIIPSGAILLNLAKIEFFYENYINSVILYLVSSKIMNHDKSLYMNNFKLKIIKKITNKKYNEINYQLTTKLNYSNNSNIFCINLLLHLKEKKDLIELLL